MEKKSIKIGLATFFIILSIIVIIGLVCYIYIDKTNSNKKIVNLETSAANMNSTIVNLQKEIDSMSNITNLPKVSDELTLGTYQVTEHIEDEAGVSFDDAGVTLADNNLCSVYEGFGNSWIGTYKIENNKLICNTIINRGENGGIFYVEKNIIFEFEIVNKDEIKLVNLSDTLGYRFIALKIGMKYKLSKNNINVLINND